MTINTHVIASERHPVDQVPSWWKTIAFGLQHVLTFYAAAVAVPVLLASALKLPKDVLEHLISADLFTCGIASLIQAVGIGRIGVRLPLLQGVSFTSLAPMIAIGASGHGGVDGLRDVYGSVIASGIITFFIAPWFAKLARFLPPVVTGTVILVIGITLLPVATNDIFADSVVVGGHGYLKGLYYGLGTLLCVLTIQKLGRGFFSSIAVLIGLIIGTAVAWFAGDAHFSDVARSENFAMTTPFYFGLPHFQIIPILSITIVMMVSLMETCGNLYAVGEIVDKPITRRDIVSAVRADGLATCLGGIFNSFPYTCFAENVGLVRLTQVKSRWVVATAACIMIILGCIPKLSAIVAGIPLAVLGGASLAMFAAVAVVGVQMLSRARLDRPNNVIIVGTSLALSSLMTTQPHLIADFPSWAQVIFGSGIPVGAFSALVLHILFNCLPSRNSGQHLDTAD
ncbi:nucleobase:cation symporter-2 family protein [Neokomagataea anthophila]|uniref:Purine permease n=1 Tax=Neokomagataea anthophila TaxID=2826925 RepID=A0ABS5E963_9PROT|nr:nucleobase:cation symporter-2 family protein [Neokomagataea anthophila]MBR0560439.1 purine permease [Neokomagataea anthophila]